MKYFLIFIDKIEKHFTIIEHSDTIKIIDNKNILMLFDGDKENILEEYEKRGIAVLKTIEGAFSFVLYDKLEQKLFIAKDKVGIKPLYYAHTNKELIIGTHLKRFSKVKNFRGDINPSTLGEYLQFGFILQPNTIFKNTYKVCAGEYISFNIDNFTHIAEKYWKLESCYKEEKVVCSESETLQKIDKKLNNIIREETKKSSNFGFSLSGGYDSSTLVAIAQKQSDKKLDTFTIGFYEEQINEAPYAKKIANFLGTNHHEYYFSESDAIEIVPKIAEIFDEPFADYGTAPTIMTTQLLKKEGIDKLIAGDGGDEVFATAENVHSFKYLQKTPKLLKEAMAKTLNSIKLQKLPYLKEYNNLPIKQHKLYQLLMAKSIPQMVYSRNTLFLEEELALNIKDYKSLSYSSFDNIDFTKYAQTVDEVIGSYFKTTMVDGELVKSYSTTNYLDIALATPFLNIELIEQMAKVPSSLKIKNDIKKYLLKEIAHNYILKELMERPKAGFAIPFSSWMRGSLKELVYSQINKKRLDKDNLFYTSSILNIRDQFYAGNEAYKYKLWRVFIFQLWYENFTKDRPSKSV